MSCFDEFTDRIYRLSQIDVDDLKLEDQVYDCLVDYTSAITGGSRLWHERISTILENAFERGDYGIIGFDEKASLETALLSNGLLSHVAELDDGVIDGIIHPGAPVFTALLSVFQKVRMDWKLFVKGVAVGYEAACRLAEAIQPGHKLLGYHASATCGTAGVAIALAVIAGFDHNHMREALGIALASSHGTLKVLEDKSELKPYNVASAVINGFVAFQMAQAGFKGADDPFEGEAGFFAQMARDVDYRRLMDNNEDLCIFKAYFKPYASCRYTHPSIEAAMEIRNERHVLPEEIEGIRIATYSIAIRHHDHTDVPNVSSAKMCIPFAAAVGIIKGSGGIDAFSEETVGNTEIRELTKKVTVVEDADYSLQFPQKSIATMTVRTKDGREYTSTVDLPKGEPDNPMTRDDLMQKLQRSCEFAGFDYDGVREYIDGIRNYGIKDYFGNMNKFCDQL